MKIDLINRSEEFGNLDINQYLFIFIYTTHQNCISMFLLITAIFEQLGIFLIIALF
jgi:hypothetical protein